MATDNITIKNVNDIYIVTCEFANGYSFVETCETEEGARSYVRGVQAGICSVKNMIAVGPHFTGRISNAT